MQALSVHFYTVTPSWRNKTDATGFGEEEWFAVLRECLSNIVRHAGATTVDVAVEVHGGEVSLTVRDDGRGIPPDAKRRGLDNLAERAQLRGGTFEVSTSDGRGTELIWTARLEREAAT